MLPENQIQLLDHFSLKVYQYIELHYASLIPYMTFLKSDVQGYYLKIQIPKIQPNLLSDLFFETEMAECTIGFHNFHQHFEGSENIAAAVKTFLEIREDKWLIVNHWLLRFDQVEDLKSGKMVKGLPTNTIDYRVTSWSGTFDAHFENVNFYNPRIKESNIATTVFTFIINKLEGLFKKN